MPVLPRPHVSATVKARNAWIHECADVAKAANDPAYYAEIRAFVYESILDWAKARPGTAKTPEFAAEAFRAFSPTDFKERNI